MCGLVSCVGFLGRKATVLLLPGPFPWCLDLDRSIQCGLPGLLAPVVHCPPPGGLKKRVSSEFIVLVCFELAYVNNIYQMSGAQKNVFQNETNFNHAIRRFHQLKAHLVSYGRENYVLKRTTKRAFGALRERKWCSQTRRMGRVGTRSLRRTVLGELFAPQGVKVSISKVFNLLAPRDFPDYVGKIGGLLNSA